MQQDPASPQPLYPPPPWRLSGQAFLRFSRPTSPGAAGFLSGLYLARYAAPSTLQYHELILFSAPRRHGWRLGARIHTIFVDSESSMRGGRDIWGLPKQPATFDWRAGADGAIDVRIWREGTPLGRCWLPPPGPALPLPVLAPFWGARDGARLWALGRGRARVSRARGRCEAEPGSALAAQCGDPDSRFYRLDDLDLRLPAPIGKPANA